MATQHQDNSLLQAQRTQLKPPPLYKVSVAERRLHPDGFRDSSFCRSFLRMDREHATRIMLKVHTDGRGMCGIYPRDVAATKVEQVTAFARSNQHPLACVMEEN
jgi:ATP-dependent Clp protease adaptor protein ClpS